MTSDTCIVRNFPGKAAFLGTYRFFGFQDDSFAENASVMVSDRTFSNSKPGFGFLRRFKFEFQVKIEKRMWKGSVKIRKMGKV